MWAWFRKKPDATRTSKDLGALFVQVAAHECRTFETAWNRELDDETQVSLFAEFGILLLAIADRFAYSTHGDPIRSQLMNPIVDTFGECFANQKHFGTTRDSRRAYFERLLAERFQKFAGCSSICGEGQDSLVFTGARHLTETFLSDIPPSEHPNLTFETGKVVGNCLTSLLQTPSFQMLGTGSKNMPNKIV